MSNKFIDPILREVAEEENLPVYVIEEIYNSPFKYMKENTKRFGNWKIYLINGLGKFMPHKTILTKIKNGEPINNFKKLDDEKQDN
jgi:hypothetical protein